MARQPSSILTPQDLKTQVKELKGEIKAREGAYKQNEKDLAAEGKRLEKLREQLLVLAPPKVTKVAAEQAE